MRPVAASVCLFLAACAEPRSSRGEPPAGTAKSNDGYVVVVEDDLSRMLVTTTVGGDMTFGDARATPFAKVRHAGEYWIDVAGLVDAGLATRVGHSICISPDVWLPRPERLPADFRAWLQTILVPSSASLSAPWPETDTGLRILDETALRWRSFVAFGRMETHALHVAGATLDVAVLDRPHAATWPGIERWLKSAADSQTKLWGEFPVSHAQVVIRPVASNQAVAFGETLRGGGPATILRLADDATDDALAADWVAVHEFVHLGMPAMPAADAWLSEGFVVYCTAELTGGRDTLLPAFARARTLDSGLTLAEESAAMERNHAHERVYQAGAAVAWLLDDELRRDGRTFDDAMREIRRAFGGAKRIVSAEEIVARLDAWLGRRLFSETTKRALASRAFPDLADATSIPVNPTR